MERRMRSGRRCGSTMLNAHQEAVVAQGPIAAVGRKGSEDLFGSSLGCGTHLASAEVQPGETVVDLGSGAGGDVLRAAQQVAPHGRAIRSGHDAGDGVEGGGKMPRRHTARPTRNSTRGNRAPAACRWISRCCHSAIASSASPRPKDAVFGEAFRVLRPGRPPHRRRYGCSRAPAEAIRADRPRGLGASPARRRSRSIFGDDPPAAISERVETVASTPIFPGSGFQRDCARGEAVGLMGCGLSLCATERSRLAA